jgi:hypothetical protein
MEKEGKVKGKKKKKKVRNDRKMKMQDEKKEAKWAGKFEKNGKSI